MSAQNSNDITKAQVVYAPTEMDNVEVRRDVTYRATADGPLVMDLYSPAHSAAPAPAPAPAVVIVTGYPDPGYEAAVGCKQKDMGAYVSWGRLLAASGLVAVTYTNRDPAADLDSLLRHLRQNAATLGIDEQRIGLWACSGNVPMALSTMIEAEPDAFKCAVLCYGFMLDLDRSTAVANAAAQFRFVNPCAGRSLDEFPRELPLFLMRAGLDEMPGLNDSIDRFVAKSLVQNLPVTLVNHATAPHAFDLFHDTEGSREIIRCILAFLRFHLLGR